MSRALRPLQAPLRRIAVLRALHLGDLLCAVPALRALRRAQPRAHVTLVGLPWAADFVARFGAYLDALIAVPALDADLAQPHRAALPRAPVHFDLALQLHGDGRHSNALAQRLGAPAHAGFHPPGRVPPSPLHLPWRDDESEVLRWLRLLAHLGAPADGDQLEFPIAPREHEQAAAALRAGGVHRAYVCIHVGAKLRSRRWPAARFAQVARGLLEQGWPLVFTGTRDESALVASVVAELSPTAAAPVLDLAGRTGLGSLAAVVAGAAALLCNDTGLSHLAAALGTPSVVVSCGSDPRRWAPLDASRHRVIARLPACRPCMAAECPHAQHPCASDIAPDEVLATLHATLRSWRRHAA